MEKERKISSAVIKKQETVAEIKDKIQRSKSIVIAEFKGLIVKEDTEIRREFRAANVEYKVLKNTLIKRALNDLGYTQFDNDLNGTTSVAFSYNDEVAAAKVIVECGKKFAGKLNAKSGLADGNYIDAEGVKALAAIPSREILISKMLGSMNAPITNFAGVLAATLRSVVLAVKAIHDKKLEQGA